MDVATWQRRLESRFGALGRENSALGQIEAGEWAYGEHVIHRLYGHVVLLHSFHAFFYGTLESAVRQRHRPVPAGTESYYSPFLVEFLTAFRSFRAAENLLHCGYPLDGFSLLRDLKDRALLFAAVVNGLTDYRRLNALDLLQEYPGASSTELLSKMRRVRVKEENRVFKLMLRSESGLSEQAQWELSRWEAFFHQEVHGSRLTSASEFYPWFTGRGDFSIPPIPNDRALAMYSNRAAEVAWMFVRLLPFLQAEDAGFGPEWTADWHLLDESLRFMVETLDKPVSQAFSTLVGTKFNFGPRLRYADADRGE